MHPRHNAYCTHFLKLATTTVPNSTAADPGILHHLGEGFKNLGHINMFDEASPARQHLSTQYNIGHANKLKEVADAATKAGETVPTTLSAMQKVGPGASALWDTAAKYKGPLAALGVGGLAAYGGYRALKNIFGGSDRPVQSNVYYGGGGY